MIGDPLSAVAVIVLDVDTGIAVLIGAVLIVSCSTVAEPLLRVVRPREPVGSILRWEGIIIDPIGAAIAIAVLDAVIEDRSAVRIVARVLTTAGAGVVIGAVAAVLILEALRRHLIADHLEIPATFAALIGAYAGANGLRPEAGLIAVTDQLHETVAAVGIKSAIALSGAEHLDRYSIERLTETLDTADIYGLADPDQEPGTAHRTTPRQLLDDSITAQHLTELVANGPTVRIIRPPARPRSGWLTICRVGGSGIVTFDQDPTTTPDSDWLVQLGPRLTRQTNQ